MRFSDEWIDLVKSSVDIVEVIGRKVQLKKTGRNFVGLCPFHAEKTPSFTVNPEKQFYHCFGCGTGGNVFNFLMQTEHISFPEAVVMVAKERGIAVPALSARESEREKKREQLCKINETAARYYYRNLRLPPAEKFRQYLKKRGISEKVAREFYLGCALKSWDGLTRFFQSRNTDLKLVQEAGLISPGRKGYIDRFRGRIMFPICDHLGRFIGFGGRSIDPGQPKYLNTAQTAVFDKGSVLYGLNWSKESVKKQQHVIVVEGYTDFISMFSIGKENTVASLGTAFTPRQAKLLSRFTKRAIIAFDGDTAGQKAVLSSMEILHQNGLQVLVAPLDKGQDPDTFVRTHSIDRVDRWLEEAVPLREYQINRIVSEHDVKTREGKLNASTELIRVLAQLGNAIEREEYLRYVAQILEISEASLAAEVNQKMGIYSRRRVQNRYNAKSVPTERAGNGGELVEREIIRSLLHNPSAARDLEKAKISADDFRHPDYRHLFVLITQNQAADEQGVATIKRLRALGEPTCSWEEYLQSFLLLLKKRRLEKIEEKLSSLENDREGFDIHIELYQLLKAYYEILSEDP